MKTSSKINSKLSYASNRQAERKANFFSLISITVVIFATASFVGFIFRHLEFQDTNIVVVYLLAVLLISLFTKSFAFGFFASLFSTIAYNYFFAEPHYAFAVSDPSYITTFITMTITALVTSTLTFHTKQSELTAHQKESEAKAMYNLAERLTVAKDLNDIVHTAVSVISECFSCDVTCVTFDENGMPGRTATKRVFGETVGGFYDWPISYKETTLGTIIIPTEQARQMKPPQMKLLQAMLESIALVMDRSIAAEQRIVSREEIIKERYRSTLLRSISHDLRTPLSAIIGVSEILIKMTAKDDPRYVLLEGIYADADWLRSMVENILSLTRLKDGNFLPRKQPEAVEEVIESAVKRVGRRSPKHEITVNIPDDVLLVPMDAKLIEQVLINLLDNAIKHTEIGDEISITVEADEQIVKFYVRDGGSGLIEKDLTQIFQAFYTTRLNHADEEHGIGLGLAICEAIIKAHGGSIEARNRTDVRGAQFVFSLDRFNF